MLGSRRHPPRPDEHGALSAADEVRPPEYLRRCSENCGLWPEVEVMHETVYYDYHDKGELDGRGPSKDVAERGSKRLNGVNPERVSARAGYKQYYYGRPAEEPEPLTDDLIYPGLLLSPERTEERTTTIVKRASPTQKSAPRYAGTGLIQATFKNLLIGVYRLGLCRGRPHKPSGIKRRHGAITA